MKKQEKIFAVLDLAERIKQAKAIVLVDFHGLTTRQMETARNLVREAGGELKVVKNTLFSLALKNAKAPDMALDGQTAVVFAGEDELAPLKAVFNFAKTQGFEALKSAIFEDRVLTKEELHKLATLPSREELLGKAVGILGALPIRLNQVLIGNEQKLVYVLRTKLEKMNPKKEGGEN